MVKHHKHHPSVICWGIGNELDGTSEDTIAYVDELCASRRFTNLRGLLYFTDGMGTYPARRPAYETAFLFLGNRFDDANVPSWAIKLVLEEEEFTRPAPAAQSALAAALAEEEDPYREMNNT